LNRSLRKVRISIKEKIGKTTILQTVLEVAKNLPDVLAVNKMFGITFSGRFSLDAVFCKCNGKLLAVFICLDNASMDIVHYDIFPKENYQYWKMFLLKLQTVIAPGSISQFFVTDGKRGLHQALEEIFPNIPRQLCIAHKTRRICQIIPRVRGDKIDKLVFRLGINCITAKSEEDYNRYKDILIQLLKSSWYERQPKSHQEKLKKVIGTARYQQKYLHTRFRLPDLIKDDITTNPLECVNGIIKERIKLFRGFKKPENARLIIKLIILYYRFHRFTGSKFKHRNGKRPIGLNVIKNKNLLQKILKKDLPFYWMVMLKNHSF
jgi:hypothetical protein